MKRIEKKELIKNLVIEEFQNDFTREDIEISVYENFKDSLKISEISGLVKSVMTDEKFIISVKIRRENAVLWIEQNIDDMWNIDSGTLSERVNAVLAQNDVTERFVLDCFKYLAEIDGFSLPKKSRSRHECGWRLIIATEIGKNPEIDLEELVNLVTPSVSSEKVARDYVRDFSWMARRAVLTSKE